MKPIHIFTIVAVTLIPTIIAAPNHSSQSDSASNLMELTSTMDTFSSTSTTQGPYLLYQIK